MPCRGCKQPGHNYKTCKNKTNTYIPTDKESRDNKKIDKMRNNAVKVMPGQSDMINKFANMLISIGNMSEDEIKAKMT